MEQVSVTVTGRERAVQRVDAIRLGLRAVQRHVARESGQLLRAALRSEAPQRTGAMAKAIGYRTSTEGETVKLRFHGPWKTHFVTKGTKEHDIWAGFYSGKSDKRFLFFEGSGVAHVHHPGANANNFVQRAYDRSISSIRDLVRAAGASLMGR